MQLSLSVLYSSICDTEFIHHCFSDNFRVFNTAEKACAAQFKLWKSFDSSSLEFRFCFIFNFGG